MSQTRCEPDFKVEILHTHTDAIDQSERTPSRRNDLQGIRGMAIVAVLLFHFFPQTFPNGHVGVDQFFVLSGFLMSMISPIVRSNRQKQFAFYEIASFYYRRVKRILPSYLLVILLSLICSSFILPFHLQSFNIESAKLALSFTTNVAATNVSRDYQNMVAKAEDLFTHTWSIAVEMQFYVIFPVIFVIYKVLLGLVGMIFLTVLCLISAWYHFTLPPPEAFNLMQSRIWQFVLGIFVNQLECRKMDGVNRFESSFLHYACLIPVVLVSFWVHPLDRAFTRIAVTLATSSLILFHSTKSYSILSSSTIVYIGDISYSLYLVHWPVYIFLRQQYENHFLFSIAGVFISIVIAGILTELFEKHYLHADRRIVIYLIVLLYAAVIVLIMSSDTTYFLNQERKWSAKLFTPVCSRPLPFAPQSCYVPLHGVKISTTQAIRLNDLHSFDDERHLWNPLCTYEEPGPFGWCHLSPTSSTSPQRILIIGNSYATNQGRIVHEMCENSYRKIDIFAKPACEAFAQSAYWYCGDAYRDYVDAVAKYKPDILFMLFRHLSWMDTPKSTAATMDPLIANASAVLRSIERHVKSQIFILDAIPRPIQEYQKTYHASLRANKPIDQRMLFNSSVNVKLARWRTQLLVSNCTKCSVIDYTPLFSVNDTFHLVDEKTKVAYVDNNMHFTPHGLYRLQELYKNICDGLQL
ncbi:hypothetical protein Aduo_003425 [Ancylostoma duodenale]